MVALANGARAAVLDFDGDTLAELAPVSLELARGLPDALLFSAELISAWASLARGAAAEARDRANEVLRSASRAEVAAAVVEAQAIRALAATALSEPESALDLARRASLVARTEGLPQLEFFAHFGLARARRYARQPHLSLRILEALSEILTKPWRAWLAWESLLAGGNIERTLLADAPVSTAKSAALELMALLGAAADGDRIRFDALALELPEIIGRFAPVHAETLELLGALDPGFASASPEVLAFRNGESVLTPASVHGLRVRDTEEQESAGAYVSLVPEARGVRLLHGGLRLVDGPGVTRIQQSQRAQGRVETLLSILGLAGPEGLDETICFNEAYGFEFTPEVHRGVFDVLVHRARATIEGAARLERIDGKVSLHPNAPLLIPDPRVSQRTTDRVLRLLAGRGAASAKDAAGLLGISLRTAQAALAELAQSGACDARKDGRNVAYVVEDSVFSEPSRRLHASDLTGLTRIEP
jgi:hypothetical protein